MDQWELKLSPEINKGYLIIYWIVLKNARHSLKAACNVTQFDLKNNTKTRTFVSLGKIQAIKCL